MGTVFMVNVANMKFCVSVFKFDIHNNLTLYYDIYDMHDYIDRMLIVLAEVLISQSMSCTNLFLYQIIFSDHILPQYLNAYNQHLWLISFKVDVALPVQS